MNRLILTLAASFVLACSSLATTRLLTFIYQPLSTFGTEQDTMLEVTRVPILANIVTENLITHIASPNRLLQDDDAKIDDSNLLSLLKVRLSAEHVSGEHYRVTFDLREMLPTDDYGVTAEQVIAGAIKCLQATFNEHKLGSYELRIQAKPDDKTNWRRHEGRYGPRKKR